MTALLTGIVVVLVICHFPKAMMNVYECYQVITSLCQFLQSEFHSEDLLRGPRTAQNPPLGSNCHQDQSSAPRRVLRI